VAFSDATVVFDDPRAVTIDDPHPKEERYSPSAWMHSVASSSFVGRHATATFG
jgi:hypothetical protein